MVYMAFPGFLGGRVVKNLPINAGDTRGMGSIPGLGRSSGGGNGNPLQYSCPKTTWTEKYSPWGHQESEMT